MLVRKSRSYILRVERRLHGIATRHCVYRRFSAERGEPEQLPVGSKYFVPSHGRPRIVGLGEAANSSPHGVKVAVIGAAGAMGKSIAAGLARDLQRMTGFGNSTLQLVGVRVGNTSGVLISLCNELRDAFEEFCPCLEVAVDLEAVQADIIIMCAGASLSTLYKSEAEVTRANIKTFEDVAEKIHARNKNALVLVVSNPMELGVGAMVDAGFRPDQVFGTGAFLQGMRFRRELAEILGVPRQCLTGLVLGRHGFGMVPIWSSVHLAAHVACEEVTSTLEQLKADGLARLPIPEEELRALARRVKEMTQDGDALKAGRLVDEQPPEYRVTLRRYLSFFDGVPIRTGKAEAVCQLVLSLLSGHQLSTAAHVQVDGKYLGLHGVIGAPVLVSSRGVRVAPVELHPAEEMAVKASCSDARGLEKAASSIKKLRGILKRRSSKEPSGH